MQVRIEGEVKKNEPLSRHTSIHTGGPADYFFVPTHGVDLMKVLRAAEEDALPYFIIGDGTNLLVSDEGFRGYVIKLGEDFETLEFDGDRVSVGAALKLSSLIRQSVSNSLSGLERLSGIPGTVGGAARTNAGAYGAQFADLVESVTGIDRRGESISIPRSEIEFGYRQAVYPREMVITRIELKLTQGSAPGSSKLVDECLRKRKSSQPWGEATAGCVFKNPSPEMPAGKLIEECGMKGRTVGDAVISPKHANFIVNRGKATSAQVAELIELVIGEVRAKTGIELRLEVEVV